RTEAGVIARADSGAELDFVETGRRVCADRARVDERHDAERAAKQTGTNARLDRKFGQRSSARRIPDAILRPDALVVVTTHRAAAARVEPPRRGDGRDRRPGNTGEASARSHHDIVADGQVVSALHFTAQVIAFRAVAARHFGRKARTDAEAAPRIEQVVRSIDLREQRDGADEEGLTRTEIAGRIDFAFARS